MHLLIWLIGMFPVTACLAAGHPLLDSISQLPGDMQARAIDTWFQGLDKRDTTFVFEQLQLLKEAASSRRMQRMREQLFVTELHYRTFQLAHGQPRIWTIFKEAIETVSGKDWHLAEGQSYILYGYYLKENGRWGPAFENMLKGYRILRDQGLLHYAESVKAMNLIGLAYYHFGEGHEALPFLLPSLRHPNARELGTYHYNTINTIALCYQRADRPDSAAYYYSLALLEAKAAGDDYFGALIQGNYGQLLYEQGRLDEALPLMLLDFEESSKNQEIGSTINAGLTLAGIFLSRDQPARSFSYLATIRPLIPDEDYAALARYYQSCFRYYHDVEDWPKAAIFADSAIAARDSAQLRKDVASLIQARHKVEVERHAHEIRELENARYRQVMFRNGILIILAMASVITLQFLYRKAYKRRKELELAEMNERITRQELDSAQQELHSFTRRLREKNELIDLIRTEMESLRLAGEQQLDERTERLNQLAQSTILTDEDWIRFRQQFEKVYPGFFIRLRESMPDLTPADTRLLALTKLKLTSKEMSAVLGIGTDAIKKSRQRLRRRVHLPEEGSLEDLIEGL